MLKYKRVFLYITVLTKLLVLVVIGFSTAEFINASNSVYLSERIVDVSHKLIVTLLSAETGQRGFIITDEESYLEPYTYAVQNLDYQLNDLALSSRAAGIVNPQVEAIANLAHSKMDELYESIKLRKTKTFEAAQDFVKNNVGQEYMSQFQTLINKGIDEERIQTDYFERIIRRTGIIIIFGLVAFSLLAVITVFIVRWESPPVEAAYRA